MKVIEMLIQLNSFQNMSSNEKYFYYSSDNGPEIYEMYWESEKRCQKLTRLIACYVHGEQTMYAISFATSVYSLLVGNYDTSTWLSTYSLVLPFSADSVVGWYARYFIQCNMGFTYAASMVPVTCFFVSCCVYIGAICEHYNRKITSTNETADEIQMTNNALKYESLSGKLAEEISRSVQLHNKLVEWVLISSMTT